MYDSVRKDENTDSTLLHVLAMCPLDPLLQNMAFRVVLSKARWGVIRRACLCHVWKHVRRELFTVAVEQRKWSVVKQWADHTLYDDQRWWAAQQAYVNKRWDVMLLLTDHGLTEAQVTAVHYRLALHADWSTAQRLFIKESSWMNSKCW
jgi:hypothetical protein